MHKKLKKHYIKNMKRILSLLTLLFAVTFIHAQSHARLSYQSVVRNPENQLVVQEEITVQFQLHNHTPSDPAVYAEQHTVTSNQNGLISLIIGEGTGQIGDLDAVTWDDAYICTQYSLAGEVMLADTQKITAVPYACYADKVPLSAIEEHLGSTQLVTINMLQDSLSQYTTLQEMQNNISLFVSRQELVDSMAHTVSQEELYNATDTLVGRQELADSLSHYIQQGDLDDAVGRLVTRQEFLDSLQQILNNGDLIALIQSLQDQISELQALQETVDMFTVPSSPFNTFTLSFTPLPNHPVLMFINGVFINTQAFTLSGNTLTYRYNYNGNKALAEGDRIQIYYSHN